jgi:hypothetical protein
VLEFIKPNMFERRTENKEARKESVTEELYYVRRKAFWATLLLWWTKAVTAIPVISITPTSLRVNKQEKLL